MTIRIAIIGVITAFMFSGAAVAVEVSKLPKKKHTEAGLYMTANEAAEYLSNNGDKTLFIDVRSRAEVNFVGMPTVADANVPYMIWGQWPAWNGKKHRIDLEVNSDFADAVERRLKAKGLTKNDTVIVMCRSGSRSAKATNLLTKLGYKNVYTIVDGFEGGKAKEGAHKGQRVVNGWKNAGLPWSYKLQEEKMYKLSAAK